MSTTGLIVSFAAVVAVVAGVRSTWSPCGLSMLSTITPIGERGRNNRFRSTATWFIVGSIVGGATLGLLTALLAAGVAALELSSVTTLAVAAVAAGVAALSDSKVFGVQIPFHRRQVNEDWLDQYRAWVYGGGFGWQIGVGVGTYIMTAAVYLLVVLAALSASPLAAFGVAVLFGTVRGLAVLLGAGITSPAALLAFHRRFDAIGPIVRWTVVGVETAVAVVAAGAAWGAVGALAVTLATLAVAGIGVVAGAPRRSSTNVIAS